MSQAEYDTSQSDQEIVGYGQAINEKKTAISQTQIKDDIESNLNYLRALGFGVDAIGFLQDSGFYVNGSILDDLGNLLLGA
ncbi:MAG: hypothetical protein ACLFUU_06865 [Desulfobacteraceae bacterium]